VARTERIEVISDVNRKAYRRQLHRLVRPHCVIAVWSASCDPERSTLTSDPDPRVLNAYAAPSPRMRREAAVRCSCVSTLRGAGTNRHTQLNQQEPVARRVPKACVRQPIRRRRGHSWKRGTQQMSRNPPAVAKRSAVIRGPSDDVACTSVMRPNETQDQLRR
jgi:hypothetical protein